jgi:hypothetical protein
MDPGERMMMAEQDWKLHTGFQERAQSLRIDRYLSMRGDERVKDWASFLANAKFKSEAELMGGKNALTNQDPRSDPDGVN